MTYVPAVLALLATGSMFAREVSSKPAFLQVSDTKAVVREIDERYDAIPPDWCDAHTISLVRETALTLVREQELPSISRDENLRRIQQLVECGEKMVKKEKIARFYLDESIKISLPKSTETWLKDYQNMNYFREDIDSALMLYEIQSTGIKYRELVDRYNGLVEHYNELESRLAREQSGSAPPNVTKQNQLHCTASTNPVTHVTDMDCR